MLDKRILTVLALLVLMGAVALVLHRAEVAGVDRQRNVDGEARAPIGLVGTSTPPAAPARGIADAVVVAPTTLPPPESPSRQAGPSVVFPDDYAGVRDPNMATLFTAFNATVKAAGERLSKGKLSADDALFAEEEVLLYSAYCALIQQQRHFYYGYETAAQRRSRPPHNTADVVYHTTGMNDMSVVFELRRAEFPDLFDRMDSLANGPRSKAARNAGKPTAGSPGHTPR